MIQRGIDMGGNPLGIPEGDQQCKFKIRKGLVLPPRAFRLTPFFFFLFFEGWTTLIDWTDEKDDDKVRSVSIETTEQWEKLGKERDLDVPFVYMNDASRDQNPLASYGSDNVAKLKDVSQKYDPKQIFQTLQNSGFLLSKI